MIPLRRTLRWLWPGLGVKRWIAVVAAGLGLVGLGAALVVALPALTSALNTADSRAGRLPPLWAVGIVLVIVGAGVTFWGMRQMVRSIVSVVSPKDHGRLAEALYAKRCLADGARLVAMGGGTGLSTLLRGLKHFSGNITAVVTVSDDGGSSGRLRRDLGILPPGDIRNCLVALADAEPLMTELFQHRFGEKAGQGLEGHSFGNLLIAALAGVTGDFKRAVEETSKVLAIRGRVLPCTLADVRLQANMEDGSVLQGETTIAGSPQRIARLALSPADAPPLPEMLHAIEQAEAIIVGPGSLYTSVLPNLLVPGVVDAIRGSGVPVIYVCNVMTQSGETDRFSAPRHLQTLIDHLGCNPFTVCLMNSRMPEPSVLDAYRREGAEPVRPQPGEITRLGTRPVVADLLWNADLARHDPHKLAAALMRIIEASADQHARGRAEG
jgi:uncharacterized cofD-like protein